MPALLIPSSWVLADTFDAVPHHTQGLDLSDPKLCHVLEFDACLDYSEEEGFTYRERAPYIGSVQRLESEDTTPILEMAA